MSVFSELIASLTGTHDALPENAILLDVRSQREWARGVIENSILLEPSQVSQHIAQHAPNKNTPLIVYCASGMRSGMVRNQLLKMGYTHVVNGGSVNGVAKKLGKTLVSS